MPLAQRQTITEYIAHFGLWISAPKVVQCGRQPLGCGPKMRDGEDLITLEVDDDGCGRLQFELPLDITEEIAYIKGLVPRAESGLLELLDPRHG